MYTLSTALFWRHKYKQFYVFDKIIINGKNKVHF